MDPTAESVPPAAETLAPTETPEPTEDPNAGAPASLNEYMYTFLVVGLDKAGYNTDTMMVGRIDTKNHEINVVSIPRDTMVNVSWSVKKVNTLYAADINSGGNGIDGLMDGLKDILGFQIDCYAVVDLNAFVQLVDAIGGVDVYSDQAFTSVGSPGYYDPTTFVEGWNHLDGKAALAFARERHAFASGDIQRGINQMKVIDAMANKLKSPALLMGFSKLMDAAADCFVTSLSQEQISALVRMQLGDLANWDIQSYTVTGSGAKSSKCYSAKGQSLYVMKPDENSVNEAKALIAAVLGGEDKLTGTSQTPEKTDVFTPTADPNAGASIPEESPDSVIAEEPAESEVPAEEAPADSQPAEGDASGEPSASTEVPADGSEEAPAGSTESPSFSMPTQEQVEQAASSLHQAASTVLDALFGSGSGDASSAENDAA